MSKVVRMLAVTLGALLHVSAQAAAPGNEDETAIRQLQNDQAAAWNAHDANAYADLFTPDGDVVNVLGWRWEGQQEIRDKLKAAYTVVFRHSVLKIEDVQVRVLSPDIAIAHVRWTMEGAMKPPGAAAAPDHGIQLQVLTKGKSGWRIASFQNTNSVPEHPFPTSPPPH